MILIITWCCIPTRIPTNKHTYYIENQACANFSPKEVGDDERMKMKKEILYKIYTYISS